MQSAYLAGAVAWVTVELVETLTRIGTVHHYSTHFLQLLDSAWTNTRLTHIELVHLGVVYTSYQILFRLNTPPTVLVAPMFSTHSGKRREIPLFAVSNPDSFGRKQAAQT